MDTQSARGEFHNQQVLNTEATLRLYTVTVIARGETVTLDEGRAVIRQSVLAHTPGEAAAKAGVSVTSDRFNELH